MPMRDLKLKANKLGIEVEDAMAGFKKLFQIAEDKAAQLELMEAVIASKEEPVAAPAVNEYSAPTMNEKL